MRVTQSMLSNNMLRNLSSSYGEMSKLQDQINSGKKITRPSDDPVVAVKGMDYRRDLGKVEQFSRNMNEVNNWLDTSDQALAQVSGTMTRVRELVVQAANDTNTAIDRSAIKTEIDQIRLQLQDVANTKLADRYIFSGTKTQQPLFINGQKNSELYDTVSPTTPIAAANGTVKIEVYDGIQLQVNTPGIDLFNDVDDLLAGVSNLLGGKNMDGTSTGTTISGKEISEVLGGLTSTSTSDDISKVHNKILEQLADIGARQNRVEMMENRLSDREVSVNKLISENEDVDYSKAITEMTTQESIHQAALSVGAKIIQQTLVDFM